MTEINSLKTLSLKNIGLTIPVGGGKYLNKTVALLSGEVEGYMFKMSTFGENIALVGNFVMVNAITGEVFEGSTLYAPDDFSKSIQTKLDKAEAGATIPLKNIEIICASSEKSARKYTFITRNFNTPELINKKRELASLMLSSLKALPAPEKKKA